MNDAPLMPPLFLTFLENLAWIRPTDAVLVRLRSRLSKTLYAQFIRSTRAQPIGGIFELNVFVGLDDAFPPAEPQPRLAGSTKRSDFRITVDGQAVYIEATVLTEGRFWDDVAANMRRERLKVYATVGPGPEDDARRVVGKVAEELTQAAPDAPNVVALSFFGSSPHRIGRDAAIRDLQAAGVRFGTRRDGSVVDLRALVRVDSFFEFSRDRLICVHVNPTCSSAFRLSSDQRARLRAAFSAPMMIR